MDQNFLFFARSCISRHNRVLKVAFSNAFHSCSTSFHRINLHNRAVYRENESLVLGNAIPVVIMKPKRIGTYCSNFSKDLCSAVSLKTSRRELSIVVAGRRSMLKNNENTHYPRFSFIHKTDIAFPKTRVCLYCVRKVSIDMDFDRSILLKASMEQNHMI